MNTQSRWRAVGMMALIVGLMAWPGAAMAADNDQDGIDDALETTGGVTLNNTLYPPCSSNSSLPRNACLSSLSKDIFIFVVTVPGGGFLATAGQGASLLTPEFLFQFITEPLQPTTAGKVDGLGVGVHVAFVTAQPTSRAVVAPTGLPTGQSAVVITVDESATSAVFGRADVGTPSNTGNVTVWPASIKAYVNSLKGGDNPVDWKKYIQRTFSHELSHAAALFATYNASFGGYHAKTGSGIVMDQSVVYNRNKQTFTIYSDYASGDVPCMLAVQQPVSNPLRCVPFTVIP